MQISRRVMQRAGFMLAVAGLAVLASYSANASEESCRKTLGEKQAERLVLECIKVMASTRPLQ